MPAIPYKLTPVAPADTAWNGPEAEKNVTQTVNDLRALFAWVDPTGNPTAKASYKFPHHQVASDGSVGDANIHACQSIVAILNGGMGGASIPDGDRQGVYDHAAGHLKHANVEPAPLDKKSLAPRGRESRSVERRSSSSRIQIRTGDAGAITVDGYAARTEMPTTIKDWLGDYSETIARGAFSKTLHERDDVRLLVNHTGVPLARTKSGTLELEEDQRGLHAVATLDDASPGVAEVVSAMKRGDLDEMSFAFAAVRQEWNQDYSERRVTEAKLYDVSVVTYPAYPGTSAAIRAQAPSAPVQARLMAMAHELREGKVFSTATLGELSELLKALAQIDELTDEWQPRLAELVGLPNPDASEGDGSSDADADADADAGRAASLDLQLRRLQLLKLS
ncbi:MAG: HK97 family phage prohead protease [Ferrimicrobium sp.]